MITAWQGFILGVAAFGWGREMWHLIKTLAIRKMIKRQERFHRHGHVWLYSNGMARCYRCGTTYLTS